MRQDSATKLPYTASRKLDDLSGNKARSLSHTEHETLSDAEFKTELQKAIPHLRAFGRSLSGKADIADDLVQETMLKAWAARERFIAGTSMRAWTFVILRNTFRSALRKKKLTEPYDDSAVERLLSAPATQHDAIHLSDLHRALMELPANQREAIILFGAGGYSYQETADITGCAIGTIKSRISRAREGLVHVLSTGRFTATTKGLPKPEVSSLEDIMDAVDRIAS